MNTSDWAAFPYQSKAYFYPDEALTESWDTLHRGDAEPLPVSNDILEAWRRYHAGNFAGAASLAEASGPGAHGVANKASGAFAGYLGENEDTRLVNYKAGITRQASAMSTHADEDNAHYFPPFLA